MERRTVHPRVLPALRRALPGSYLQVAPLYVFTLIRRGLVFPQLFPQCSAAVHPSPHHFLSALVSGLQEEKRESPGGLWAVPAAAYTVLTRCLREGVRLLRGGLVR